jgi:hypothetical protein
MNIRYVDHSIGNNFGNVIELNENLKKYPRLHRAIIQHELGHTNKLFSKKDLALDLTEHRVKTLDLISFMVHHPKSLYQFRPFYWDKNRGFIYDFNLILVETTLLLMFIIFIYLGVNF